jgi:hypothetical protein
MTTPPPPPPMGMPMGNTSKNGLGTWALVLGILSIVCCGFIAGVPAIILGIQSKKAAAEGLATNGNLGNIGFILGIIGTAWTVVAAILNVAGVFGSAFLSSTGN